MMVAIDAHIHLDMYSEESAKSIIADLEASQVQGLIAVSRHLDSCKATKHIEITSSRSCFCGLWVSSRAGIANGRSIGGFNQLDDEHKCEMIAVGEIGLPYYTRQEVESEGQVFDLAPYIQLLERFLRLAAEWDKPVVLHAVYEDAEIVCDLLAKHGLQRAHFHWFKGSNKTVERMMDAGYSISITPDVLYEEEIRTLVRNYPLELMMVETDGPWPFEGPFAGEETHPRMIHAVIEQIAELKRKSVQDTALFYSKTPTSFYRLSP